MERMSEFVGAAPTCRPSAQDDSIKIMQSQLLLHSQLPQQKTSLSVSARDEWCGQSESRGESRDEEGERQAWLPRHELRQSPEDEDCVSWDQGEDSVVRASVRCFSESEGWRSPSVYGSNCGSSEFSSWISEAEIDGGFQSALFGQRGQQTLCDLHRSPPPPLHAGAGPWLAQAFRYMDLVVKACDASRSPSRSERGGFSLSGSICSGVSFSQDGAESGRTFSTLSLKSLRSERRSASSSRAFQLGSTRRACSSSVLNCCVSSQRLSCKAPFAFAYPSFCGGHSQLSGNYRAPDCHPLVDAEATIVPLHVKFSKAAIDKIRPDDVPAQRSLRLNEESKNQSCLRVQRTDPVCGAKSLRVVLETRGRQKARVSSKPLISKSAPARSSPSREHSGHSSLSPLEIQQRILSLHARLRKVDPRLLHPREGMEQSHSCISANMQCEADALKGQSPRDGGSSMRRESVSGRVHSKPRTNCSAPFSFSEALGRLYSETPSGFAELLHDEHLADLLPLPRGAGASLAQAFFEPSKQPLLHQLQTEDFVFQVAAESTAAQVVCAAASGSAASSWRQRNFSSSAAEGSAPRETSECLTCGSASSSSLAASSSIWTKEEEDNAEEEEATRAFFSSLHAKKTSRFSPPSQFESPLGGTASTTGVSCTDSAGEEKVGEGKCDGVQTDESQCSPWRLQEEDEETSRQPTGGKAGECRACSRACQLISLFEGPPAQGSVRRFVRRLQHFGGVTEHETLLALLLIASLLQRQQHLATLSPTTASKLLLASLCITQKAVRDVRFSAPLWAAVGGVSASELAKLEGALLELIDYRLPFSLHAFAAIYTLAVALSLQQNCKLQPRISALPSSIRGRRCVSADSISDSGKSNSSAMMRTSSLPVDAERLRVQQRGCSAESKNAPSTVAHPIFQLLVQHHKDQGGKAYR